MTERYEKKIIGCISKQRRAELDEYCWKNRTSQSAVLRNLVETLLTGGL
jgi:cytoplasmic iron level regulating protein YaaA (DUF328/UPF0246 family)